MSQAKTMSNADLSGDRFVISGASGMVGHAVAKEIAARGGEVLRLVRREPRDAREIGWDPSGPSPSIEKDKLEGARAFIHLSGENIAEGRWTEERKRRIVDSRIATTSFLVKTIASLEKKPSVLVSASAVGIYGNRGSEELDEQSAKGTGFLADICEQWEAAAGPVKEAGVRLVLARFGVILSAEDGALAKLLPIFKAGVGGRVGSGEQYMAWVELGDVARACVYAIENESLDGPIDVVAPEDTTNAAFAKALAHALHRPAFVPTPAFAIKLAFGQMGEETILASQRVAPAKLLAAGFSFEHPTLESALAAALGKS